MDQCQLESSRFSRLFVTCTPVSTSNQTTKRRMISKSTSARRCASGMSRLGRSRSTRTPDEWLCHSSASRCSCMAEMPTPLHLNSPDFEQGHPMKRAKRRTRRRRGKRQREEESEGIAAMRTPGISLASVAGRKYYDTDSPRYTGTTTIADASLNIRSRGSDVLRAS